MRFIDFFAGVGGMRRGLELAGHKCVGFCEFDKYAVGSYVAMHCMTDSDIEKLKNIPIKVRKDGLEDKKDRLKEVLKSEYRHGEWYADDIRNITGGVFQERNVGHSEHLVKTSLSLENEKDCRETDQALWEKFLDYWRKEKRKIDLHGLSMKMLRECFLPTEDLTTSQSSLKWTDLGTIVNGKIYIANGTCRNTESGFTLSDILEKEVGQKYFLSMEQMAKIVWM